MANLFYCKYCGKCHSSPQALTFGICQKSPTKKHQIYDGSAKPEYVCKFCGIKSRTIQTLTASQCRRSPHKYHEPL